MSFQAGLSTAKIYWIFGKIGTGKTSYAAFHGKKRNCQPLFIGKECRKKFGASVMAKSVNPIAPDISEKFVREMVIDAVANLDFGQTLFVDGMPRKPSQVRWIKEQFNTPDFQHYMILFTCDDDIRQLRLNKRDSNIPDDLELTKARLHAESHNILRVVEEALFLAPFFNGNMSLTTFDNTDDDPLFRYSIDEDRANMNDMYDSAEVEAVKFTDYNIGRMFSAIRRFSDVVLKKFGISMAEIHQTTYMVDKCDVSCLGAEWARKFIIAARDELDELLEELPDRWWLHKDLDLRAARVELIDAWHFFMSGSIALGMDYHLFSKIFFDKLAINEQRQNIGKKEGDDKHIGIVRRSDYGDTNTESLS